VLNSLGQMTGGIPGLYYVPTGFLGDANSSSVMFSSERTFGGETVVKEAFTEFQIPLLKDKPFFENLSTDLAARWANYSGAGNVWAYKGGLDWAVNDTVRFRVTRSQDVRAASLEERFDVTRQGVSVRNPYVLTDGQPTLQSGAGFSGGNPDLKPEVARTWTAGFVLTPQFVQGLSVSVDWYKINIADAIDKPSTQDIVDFAFAGDPTYQQLVKLDANRNIVEVDQYFINFSQEFIEGVNFEVAYRHSADLVGMLVGGSAPESFSGRLYATDMYKHATLTQFGSYLETAGTIGIPKQKATADLTYSYSQYSAFIQARYTSGGLLSSTLVQSQVALTDLPPGVFTINDNHIPGTFLVDLNLSWEVPISAGDLRTYFEVNNVFDKQPPQCPGIFGRTGVGSGACGGDPLGRRYTVGLTYKY
jgi:outer membrane receptor protein involved in Fe transport